jgi:hypothetical protein
VANQSEQRSSAAEIFFLVCVLAPVTGGILAGPIVGSTLMSLAMLDTVLLLAGWGH